MILTVYSRFSCVQCDSTYRALDSNGINFRIVFVETDESATGALKELGYLSAPVVKLSEEMIELLFDGLDAEQRKAHPLEEHWSGFRPDQISKLAEMLAKKGVSLAPRDIKQGDQQRRQLKERAQMALLAA